MHFAAHGHTAAEIVYIRSNAEKEFMGMTAFEGGQLRKADASIAKNYLNEDEINILNRLVTAYLEFAELQAIRQKPMYMKDWIAKLDDFIKMSGSELLSNAGKISHDQAKFKAELEYEFSGILDRTGRLLDLAQKRRPLCRRHFRHSFRCPCQHRRFQRRCRLCFCPCPPRRQPARVRPPRLPRAGSQDR